MRPLRGLQETRVATREESGVLGFPSRRGLTPRGSLQSLCNPCSLSQGCHLTISPSIIPFSSCLQSFPGSGSFQMSQFFTSGGQRIRVSCDRAAALLCSEGSSGLFYVSFLYKSRASSPCPREKTVQLFCTGERVASHRFPQPVSREPKALAEAPVTLSGSRSPLRPSAGSKRLTNNVFKTINNC